MNDASNSSHSPSRNAPAKSAQGLQPGNQVSHGFGQGKPQRSSELPVSGVLPDSGHAEGENDLAGSNPPTDQSTARRNAPVLTHRGLALLLVAMCLVPTITIFALWSYLPPVYEGQLEGDARTTNLPPAEFYDQPFRDRQPFEAGQLHVLNRSDQVWTMLNVQINHFYQIYDREPLNPGEERAYELDRFVTRTGAIFDLRYNPVKNVRVYARRPTRDRATFFKDFELPAE